MQQVALLAPLQRRRGAVHHARAPQDLQDARPAVRAAASRGSTTRRASSVASTSAVNARSVPQSTPMTAPRALGAHHVHRQVVHRAAIDEDFAALEHGRQHARDRDRSPQPAPQRSLLVHGDAAGRQVRRHAEEGQGQVLDVDVAEFAPQQHADLAARDERDQRQREVRERVGVDETALEAQHELLVVPVRGDSRGEDGAHAAAADDVDRHAVFPQRAHDAEVREAARTAAGEHETDGAPVRMRTSRS